MVKKVLSFGVVLFMLFSFVGCTNGCMNLKDYKANAKSELDTYVSELHCYLGDVYYKNYLNGPGLDEVVNKGKNAIDKAFIKKSIDRALDNAKKAIDAIPIAWVEPHLETAGWESPGSQFPGISFWLKYFNFNEGVYFDLDCDINAGTLSTVRATKIFAWYTWMGEMPQQTFIDIRIVFDDTIIGYMVVEMYLTGTIYTPRLLVSVVSSKINNEYQPMDEEQVKTAIEAIKEKYKK